MGSTTWDYFVPYDEDADAALQRLREQVFRKGHYQRFTLSADDLEFFQEKPGMVDPAAPAEKQMEKQEGETMLQWAMRVQRFLNGTASGADAEASDKPDTIDELLEEQGESGTHSILDIQRVSEEPEFGAVSPMPSEELEKLFGTAMPSRKMVEDKLSSTDAHDLVEHPLVSERWQGVYFTIYRAGRPDELFFMGTSGD